MSESPWTIEQLVAELNDERYSLGFIDAVLVNPEIDKLIKRLHKREHRRRMIRRSGGKK